MDAITLYKQSHIPRVAGENASAINAILTAMENTGLIDTQARWDVTAENPVYRYTDSANGSGPMWCRGNTCIANAGGRLFVSGTETIPDAKPLNNCRWQMYEFVDGKWLLRNSDPVGRTREPSPIGVCDDGTVWLSVNPTLTPHDTFNGPSQPEMLEWKCSDVAAVPVRHYPAWDGQPSFTEHSYRSISVDAASREMFITQNIDMDHCEWSFRDIDDLWSTCGKLKWPWGAEYDVPQPIRICYANTQLRNRAVYLCGVSDIVEPNPAWKLFKKELTGKDWDYDFRRLFFAWTPDITRVPFQPWLEIASREDTCGWITPCDLYADSHGRVHLIWIERAIDDRLKAKFFPEAVQSYSLNYAIVLAGKVVHRKTLVQYVEDSQLRDLQLARFHVTADERLFVFYYEREFVREGLRKHINRIVELYRDGTVSRPQNIVLQSPLVDFFTATVRSGSTPSDTLHLLGLTAAEPRTIKHVALELR